MQNNYFLALSILLLISILVGRLVKFLKLPNVTGYLIAGLLLGPNVFGIISENTLSNFNIISEIALGFIAFSIGNEFKISYFKRVGVTPIVIAILESFFAVVFVVAALLIAGQELPFSLALGSIAAATAPAATIMVINQYKAKGPVTDTLLSVVAIDDATALIMFGISIAIAQTILSPKSASIVSATLASLWEIVGALIIGAILGLIFTVPLRFFKKDSNRIAITCGFVLLGLGIAQLFGFSSLLLCMAMGATLVNISTQAGHIMKLVDGLTPPIFILFFAVSGAQLKLSILPQIGVVGVIYIVLRVIGKMFGAYVGALACKADKNIRKYLGPALMPQAGVAIGLSLLVTKVVPDYGPTIRAVILCGTLIYELIGPVVAKICLVKAGEIENVSANKEILETAKIK